jgi:hypothetical protein
VVTHPNVVCANAVFDEKAEVVRVPINYSYEIKLSVFQLGRCFPLRALASDHQINFIEFVFAHNSSRISYSSSLLPVPRAAVYRRFHAFTRLQLSYHA